MKSIEKNQSILSKEIKKQIIQNIIDIKIFLKEDKEFSDKIIEKILTLNTEQIPPHFIRSTIIELYERLKNNITPKIYRDFTDFENKLNNLARLINLNHKITKDILDKEYKKIYYKMLNRAEIEYEDNKTNFNEILNITLEAFDEYKYELSNLILSDINNSYQLSIDELQVLGTQLQNTDI